MEKFKEIKKKFHKAALLKSILFGVGAGGVSAGSALLVLKLTATAFYPYLLALGAIGLALLVFGISFLLTVPTNKRLAKYLDKGMGTGEKVQTMVEFSDKEGAMVALQRADTEKRLQNAPKSVIKIKKLWPSIVAGCLALVTLTTALVIPAKAEVPKDKPGPVEPDTPPFEANTYHLKSLEQLIEEVKKSEMELRLKEITIEELEGLLVDIPQAETREDMLALVHEVMLNVDKAVEETNTYFELATAMTASSQEQVQKLGKAIGSLELERFTDLYQELSEDFKIFVLKEESEEETGGTEEANETKAADGTEETEENGETEEDASEEVVTTEGLISEFSLGLTVAFALSGVSETDALYQATSQFQSGLVALIPNIGLYTETSWATKINSLWGEYTNGFNVALGQQIANDETRDYVIDKLKEIFGITDAEMPEISSDFTVNEGNSGKPGEDDDESINSGGLGTGDIVFGSDDIVYDPATGEQVSYGEIINRYYAAYIEDLSAGKIDPDLEKILQQYFDALYGGLEEKEEN